MSNFPRVGCVYKIVCLSNNKTYIGQTLKNFYIRKKAHLSLAFNPKSVAYEYPLYRAIRKHGLDNFAWSILEDNIPEELLDNREQFWIIVYNSTTVGHGYNSTNGGSGGSKRYTQEVCDKISQDAKRRHSLGKYARAYGCSRKPVLATNVRTGEVLRFKSRTDCAVFFNTGTRYIPELLKKGNKFRKVWILSNDATAE